MRERKPSCVVTFHTTADAMETERVCKALGLAGRLIPAPRALTADCGIAWRAPAELAVPLREALAGAGIEPADWAEGLY